MYKIKIRYLYIYIYAYFKTWYTEYALAQLIEALRMVGSIPEDVIGIFH